MQVGECGMGVPMHREQGTWPLHLVRMRWQWSQARLTLRFTGAEALRSGLGVSVTVTDSMVAVAAVVKTVTRMHRRKIGAGGMEAGTEKKSVCGWS